MISYEENDKKNSNEDVDDVKFPTTVIVIVIVIMQSRWNLHRL